MKILKILKFKRILKKNDDYILYKKKFKFIKNLLLKSKNSKCIIQILKFQIKEILNEIKLKYYFICIILIKLY